MPVTIKSTGGGSVTLTAPNTASDYTATLPASNNTLIAVAPGSSGNVLTSDGTNWTSATPTSYGINVQTFTGSGTWTKPSGYAAGSRVLIQAWGGGGSGSRGNTAYLGGGGGGGYNERWLTLSTMGATETVTVGAGGTSITSGASVGNNGGNTTVGSLITAYGGAGGSSTSNAVNRGGGGGGQLSAGSAANPGGPLAVIETDGAGGYSYVGGSSNLANQSGFDGLFQGGGGGSGGGTYNGGKSVWGGGGGGGSGATGGSGGASSFGGAGGAGASGTSGNGTAGTAPGGAGGGTYGGTSGAGAAGQVIITVFPA